MNTYRTHKLLQMLLSLLNIVLHLILYIFCPGHILDDLSICLPRAYIRLLVATGNLPKKRRAGDGSRAVCKNVDVTWLAPRFMCHTESVPYIRTVSPPCLPQGDPDQPLLLSLFQMTLLRKIYSDILSRPFPSWSKLLRCNLDRSVSTGPVGFEESKIGGM
jgi:hypothetical protein